MSEDSKQISLDKVGEDNQENSETSYRHIRQLGIDPPGEWEEIRIGKIGELDTSSVDKKSDAEEKSVDLVNYMDVYERYIINSEIDYMGVTAPDSHIERSQVVPGDILFTPSSEEPGDIGNSAVVTEEMERTLHSYHTVRLRPTSANIELDIGFSGWLANAPYVAKQFARRATGSTRYTLTLGDFAETRVLVPPVSEQRKIASVLYTVDQTIQKTEEIISQRVTVKQGLMQDIFRYGVDSKGELRRSDEDEPYQDTKYGSAPKGWDIEPLDSIVPDDAPVTYGIVKPGDHHPGGVPVVKVENIMDGAIDQEGLLHTDPEIHEQYKRAELNEGDLLFTIRGTVGRMAFVPEELDGGNLTQDTARIRVDGANPRFVHYYLDTATPNNYFERHTKGQAVQGINLEDLREVPVHLPSKEEQNRIVGILDSHTEQIRTERNYRDRLKRLKQGLMQDLLSGEVRTHDRDIEIVDDVLQHG